ncbi:hypothetical protein [Mariniblastus fucicola]|uniref:TIGR03067 domain-containing protein n=1 Tax=Mariniblastus fucicola TaxID=980251 RepID=A0A5B9PEP1_9BACT|nr:hypothetical protein [Mariniblastus fucicola]QEG23066.1 hypothetical protein MFFC18_29580 [Mariniblastus fucicola]
MKTFALCTAGFVAGMGIAAATQTPVLETLGYLPEKEVAAVSNESGLNDEAEISKNASAQPSAIATDSHVESPEDRDLENGNFGSDETSAVESGLADSEPAKTVADDETTSAENSTQLTENKAEIAESSKAAPKKIRNSFVKANEGVSDGEESARPMAKVVNGERKSASEQVPSIAKPATTKPETPRSTASSESPAPERVVVAKAPMDEPSDAKDRATVPPSATADSSATADEAKTAAKTTDRPESNDTKTEPSLDGTWQVTKAVHGGRKIPTERLGDMTIQIEGQNILVQQGDKQEIGKLKSADASPVSKSKFSEMEIESTRENVPSIRGFYYFEGDKLTMVWGSPGADRPNPSNASGLESARILTLSPVSEP